MNGLTIFKAVVEVAISLGTGTVVGNVIKATTPENMSKFGKVLVGIGSFAVSGLVSEAAVASVNRQIDTVRDSFQAQPVDSE